MGVSKNRGTPKWMVRENPIKMDDLGVPLFSETSIYIHRWIQHETKDLKVGKWAHTSTVHGVTRHLHHIQILLMSMFTLVQVTFLANAAS